MLIFINMILIGPKTAGGGIGGIVGVPQIIAFFEESIGVVLIGEETGRTVQTGFITCFFYRFTKII